MTGREIELARTVQVLQPTLAMRTIRRLPFGRRAAVRIYNRALMHLCPKQRTRTYFGALLDCDVRDLVQATIIHLRCWEPNTSRALTGLIARGDTVIDVGANVGYYSLLFSRVVGAGGHVVAIEALPQLAEKIRSHAGLNHARNIRVVNMAATAEAGEIIVYQGPHTNIGATTTLASKGFAASLTVPAAPLDLILSEREKASCTLIKMDIEGAEVPVLDRLLDQLDQFPRNPAIAVELSDDPEWQRLFQRFLAKGYRAFDLHNEYDWLRLMDAPALPPTPLQELPARQADVLFRFGA